MQLCLSAGELQTCWKSNEHYLMIPQALNPSACLCSPPISAHLCQGSNPLWLIGWIYRDYFIFFIFFNLPRDSLKRSSRLIDGYIGGSLSFMTTWQSRHQLLSETLTHQKWDQKKVAHTWVLPVTLMRACFIPLPLTFNYDTVSTGRLLQHRSRLITLTSDPLCSEAFRSLRSMYLSSHPATSRFL